MFCLFFSVKSVIVHYTNTKKNWKLHINVTDNRCSPTARRILEDKSEKKSYLLILL